MKHRTNVIICAVLALVSPRVFAATTNVLPGQSIQAAVNAATAGDQIIIAGGAYAENLTINKNLDFRREAGTAVHLSGNVTFSGITGAFVFAHFRVGSDNTKSLAINNCQNVFLEDVNASGGGGLSTTGSKVYAYDCSFGNAVFNSSNWTLQECVISGDVTSNSSDTKVLRCTINGNLAHNTTGTYTCTVFQSTIAYDLTTAAKRSWIGYNKLRKILISGSAEEAEVVGNTIVYGGVRVNAASLVATVRNNTIADCSDAMYVSAGTKVSVHNNIFVEYNTGIEVLVAAGEIEVIGNVFRDSSAAVRAPFEAGGCYYNYLVGPSSLSGAFKGGVVQSNNYLGINSNSNDYNPAKFTWLKYSTSFDSDDDYHLAGQSPLKNAGSPLPEFKNHDGTRQDIGLYGGHHYDPQGTTADRPVILSAELTPKRIYNGGTTTIKIKSRAVVSTPKQ
jgi:hypothetical protein